MQSYEKITNYETFWKIWTFKIADDTPTFLLLMKLVNFINILPHSSAAVERLFSFVNLNKTNIRNRLSTDLLIAIHTSRLFRFSSCFDFQIADMIDMLSSKIYKMNTSLNESTSSTSTSLSLSLSLSLSFLHNHFL